MKNVGVNGAAAGAARSMREAIEALESQRGEYVSAADAITQSLKNMRAVERSLIMGGKPVLKIDDRPVAEVPHKSRAPHTRQGGVRGPVYEYLKDHPGSTSLAIARGAFGRATKNHVRAVRSALSGNPGVFVRSGMMRHATWAVTADAAEKLARGEATRRGIISGKHNMTVGADGLAYYPRVGSRRRTEAAVTPGARRAQIIADLAKHGPSAIREVAARCGIRATLVSATASNHPKVFRLGERNGAPARERIMSLQQNLAGVAGAKA